MNTRKLERLYPHVAMFIGDWSNSERGERLPVVNSASDETFGELPKASRFDLRRGVAAGEADVAQWNRTPPRGCEKILEKSSRAADIALTLTSEHGKPLAEALGETAAIRNSRGNAQVPKPEICVQASLAGRQERSRHDRQYFEAEVR